MPGPSSCTITIEFTGWWLGGTGRSGGASLDMVAYRDPSGCPALPMTQVKGLLRETAETNPELIDPQRLVRWFGQRSETGRPGAPGTHAWLRFAGDARLPEGDTAFFAQNGEARSSLFSVLKSTRINARGVAQTDSLRSIEVCVPMTISGAVDWIGDEPPPEDWVCKLDMLCAFTPAFGKLRNDGMGRAVASAS